MSRDGYSERLPPHPALSPDGGEGCIRMCSRLLTVGAAAHWVGLPADEACLRQHAGIDGRARPLALEHGGDLAAEATARLGGHARGGRGDVRRDDDVVHVQKLVERIDRLL